MKTLPLKTQLKIYNYLLHNFDNDTSGFCNRINKYIIKYNYFYSLPNPYFNLEPYSILYKYKPISAERYWFDPYDTESRKKILIKITTKYNKRFNRWIYYIKSFFKNLKQNKFKIRCYGF